MLSVESLILLSVESQTARGWVIPVKSASVSPENVFWSLDLSESEVPVWGMPATRHAFLKTTVLTSAHETPLLGRGSVGWWLRLSET